MRENIIQYSNDIRTIMQDLKDLENTIRKDRKFREEFLSSSSIMRTLSAAAEICMVADDILDECERRLTREAK